MKSKLTTLAIIGRPNVGKSTLFNRLIGRRRALVHDMPGVTRDRIEETTEWSFQDKTLRLRIIDTGGLGGDRFAEEIKRQVSTALSEADIGLLILDGKDGVLPGDEELVRELKQSGVMDKLPVIGIVNKVDAEVHEERGLDFHRLGLDSLLTVSAEHNRGIDDIKTAIFELAHFEEDAEEALALEEDEEELIDNDNIQHESALIKVAVIGKPNVGKSTLINALLGEERMITSPIAGTTTDSVDSAIEISGRKYLFVDTAGIRRKGKTEQGVEVLSVVQTKKAIERAEVIILLLDGEEGISDQDEKIAGLTEELGRSVIIAMNKWDTQRNNQKFTQEMAAEIIRKKMGFLKYAPIVFLSAKRGEGLEDLPELIDEIVHQRRLKISTHEFTDWVRTESTVHNPANVKFFMCHQAGRNPPTFVCHVNHPEKVHYSLSRHLVNAIRDRWGFMGTPIRLLFVAGKSDRPIPKKVDAQRRTKKPLTDRKRPTKKTDQKPAHKPKQRPSKKNVKARGQFKRR